MPVKFWLDFSARRKADVPSPDRPVQDTAFSLNGREAGTVILVHGLTGTPQEMKGVGRLLHQQGYQVVCPRLANHGAPMTVLQRTRWQECYETVRQTLLSLDAAHTPGPVFVAGLSMGALLALLLAEEFPTRIAGVSCLSPTLFYDGWNMRWPRHLLPLGYFTPLKYWYYFKEEPPYGVKNEAIRHRLQRYFERTHLHDISQVAQYGYPYFPVSLLCELHFLVKHLTRRLPRIATPVQFIQAEEDDMTSVKNSQFLYERVRSEIKELILLKDSYHIITVDQERALVAQKMGEFFRRISQRSVRESAGVR